MALMAFRGAAPRQAPYPNDLLIVNGATRMGFRTGSLDKDGAQLEGTKPQDQGRVVPSAYGYQAQNPILEAVSAYGAFTRGMGLYMQQSPEDAAYSHALGVDCSGPMWIKGPEIGTRTPSTVDASYTVNRMFEIGGSIFWTNGRYVYQRTSDTTETLFLDCGSGKHVYDVEVFQHNALGGLKYAYLAMGDYEAVWRIGSTPEVQTIVISGTPAGGTWRVQWVDANSVTWTSDALPYNATSLQVQTAIQQFATLEGVSVDVSGTSPNFTYTVTFYGLDANPAQFTSVNSLTGGASPAIAHATTTAYAALAAKQCVEQQTVVIGGTPAGGTYTLAYGTATTTALAYNADGPTVQAALRLLSGLATVTVATTGTSPNYTHTVTFTGVGANATLLYGVGALTGGTPTITITTTHVPLFARALLRKGREFWRAVNNFWSKVDPDSDPQYEENWTSQGSYETGDRSQPVNRFGATITGTVIGFKPDQPYSLSDTGEEVPLLPGLKNTPDTAGGECLGQWMNDLYVGYGKALYKIDPGLGFHEVGLDKLVLNQSEVQGIPTACAGHDTFNLYCAYWNPDTNTAYLMKYGGWLEIDQKNAVQGGVRTEVWNGSITLPFTGDKITCLYKSTIGAPSNHSRMYMGFSSGKTAWFTLPCQPNPAACSSYTFTTSDTYLYLPTWTAGFNADVKALRALSVSATNFSGSHYLTAEYKDDPVGTSYTALAVPFNTGQLTRVEFPTLAATLLNVRFVFHSAAVASSPQIVGCGIHYQLHTDLRQVFHEVVLVDDGLVKRDGRPYRHGAKAMRDFLITAIDTPVGVTITHADQTTRLIKLIDWTERVAWDKVARKWRSAIELHGTEVLQSQTYGTYAQMEPYTYGSLEAFQYGQLERLN